MSRGKRKQSSKLAGSGGRPRPIEPTIAELPDGTREWRRHGVLHRLDGPAVEGADGTLEWWRDGKRHRDDGPAIEATEDRWWVRDGVAKHEPVDEENDGLPGGVLMWWINGELHREDGPAIVHGDGTLQWFQHGMPHRDGGPAVEIPVEKARTWMYQGQIHRNDGPAIEGSWGRAWYMQGQLHREDGPAIEYADGSREWWLRNVEMSEAKHTRTMLDFHRAQTMPPGHRHRPSDLAEDGD